MSHDVCSCFLVSNGHHCEMSCQEKKSLRRCKPSDRGPSPIGAKTYGSVLDAMSGIRSASGEEPVPPSRSQPGAVLGAMLTPGIAPRSITQKAHDGFRGGGPE